jgi:3D (Asp-Asp-Asp) domain-containing protein
MKSSFIRFSLSFFALLFSASCSLDSAKTHTAKLKKGTRYEVRSALAKTGLIEPLPMRSRYFVYKGAQTTKVPYAPAYVPAEKLPVVQSNNRMYVRTTAYCHDENDHIVYGKLSAAGSPLRYGTVRSAAADWSRFPLGTRFRVANQPGIIYEVDDYGSALVGTNTIDIYCPSQLLMNHWGVRHLDIEIINWGSFERSAQLMRDRTAYPHIREMLNSISRMPSYLTADAFEQNANSLTAVRYPAAL